MKPPIRVKRALWIDGRLYRPGELVTDCKARRVLLRLGFAESIEPQRKKRKKEETLDSPPTPEPEPQNQQEAEQ